MLRQCLADDEGRRCRQVYTSVQCNYGIRSSLIRGRILGRNPGKNLKSFPPSFSKSPLQLCLKFLSCSLFRISFSYFTLWRRKEENHTLVPMVWEIYTETSSLRTLKFMPRNLNKIVRSWIWLQDRWKSSLAIITYCTIGLVVTLFSRFLLKPNSWTYYFTEVSRHNLESSQTWGFWMDFLNHRKGGMVFSKVTSFSPSQ